MDFNLNYIIHSSKLLFTPRLKQALTILEISSQELFDYIGEQMEENPVLEFTSNERSPYENSFCKSIGELGIGEEVLSSINPSYEARISLKEYLIFQLNISNVDSLTNAIGKYLIHNVDQNGYLTLNLTDTAAYFHVPIKKIKKVLNYLQTFDPSGICARNLKECLLIQLRDKKEADREAFNIVKNHLDDVACNSVDSVAQQTGLSACRVRQLFSVIKKLDPKPGSVFYNVEDINYVVPDIIVQGKGTNIKCDINPDAFPQLGINNYYKGILENKISQRTREFILNRINSGMWLIKCIELRKSSLLKVARLLGKNEKNFFLSPAGEMIKISRDTANSYFDVNDFILDRLLNFKYLQFRKGCIEIKHFFER